MRVARDFDIRRSREIVETARAYVRHGLSIPDRYARIPPAIREPVFEEGLLKPDLDAVVAATPLIVAPYGANDRTDKFQIREAIVEEFSHSRQDPEISPLSVKLKPSQSIYMVEPFFTPDLAKTVHIPDGIHPTVASQIRHFRIFPDSISVWFHPIENVGRFTPKDYFRVRLEKFAPADVY